MDFELRFTDKEITAWGGMALMKRMLDHLGFDQALADAQSPAPGNNRGYANAVNSALSRNHRSRWTGIPSNSQSRAHLHSSHETICYSAIVELAAKELKLK